MSDEFAAITEELSKIAEGDCAVVLIGSAARGCRTKDSDIDILLIATDKVHKMPLISGYHIKFSTDADFLRRLEGGEDFESWCVRFGVTLMDRGIWTRIKNNAGNTWPRWQIKAVHGIRRLLLASQLSKIGDDIATREELIFVLGHIARGLLLKSGVFPLSRPELAAQLKSIGYSQLAELHERLRNSESASPTDLSLALLYSKKLLAHLDRETYGRIAREYANIISEKESKRAALTKSRNGVPKKPARFV